MKAISLRWFSVAAALLISGPTFATHEPAFEVDYDGTLSNGVPVIEFIGWGSVPNDGYDWWHINVISGQQVSFGATRLSGDLLLNVHVFQGLFTEGVDFPGGTELFGSDNGTTPDVSGMFTPTFTGPATLVVSTWETQVGGDYELVVRGIGSVPEPGSLLLLGIALIGFMGARRFRHDGGA